MATYDRTDPAIGNIDLRGRTVKLHWWAIFGGNVIGWGLLFFLSLLGLTIGLAAIEPYSVRPASGLDVGSAIWALAAIVLSSIVGAYIVVRIAGERRRREASLYGLSAWGLSMIAGALLAMTAGRTAARAAAENPPRSSARTDANGNLRMSQRDRERADQAKNAAAKTAGASTAAAFLALLGSLLGAGLGAAGASGRKVLGRGRGVHDERELLPYDRDLGRTSVAGGELADDGNEHGRIDRDQPTILPPTH